MHTGSRLLASFVGLAALYGGLEALAFVIIVLLAGTCVPAASVVRQVALGILAVFGLNAVVLTALAVVAIPVDFRGLATGYLIAAALVSLASRDVTTQRFASLADWCAVGAASLAFIALYRPFIGASPGEMMAQLSYTSDAANHLTLVRGMIENGGYLTTSDYPPAWAGSAAMLVGPFLQTPIEPTSLVASAAPLMAASYALLVFFSVVLPLDYLRRATGRHAPMVAIVTAAGVGIFLLVGPGLLVVRSGSYPQMAAMTSLLAITSVLVCSDRASCRMTALLGVLAVVVMQTWYLLAPVLVALLIVYAVRLGPSSRSLLVTAAVVLPLAAYPLSRAPAAFSQINALGIAIVPHSLAVVGLLLVTLAAVVMLLRLGSNQATGLPLATLAVATLATTVIVLALQAATGGQATGYYGAKMLHAVMVFGTVAAASAAAAGYARATVGEAPSGAGTSAAAFALAVAVVLGGSVVATSHWSWPYAAGRPPASSDGKVDDGAVLDAILAAHPEGLPPGTDAWVAGGCNPRLEHNLSKWTHDLFDTWTPERRLTSFRLATGDLTPLEERAAAPELERLEIYVGEGCERAGLLHLERLPQVVIIRVP